MMMKTTPRFSFLLSLAIALATWFLGASLARAEDGDDPDVNWEAIFEGIGTELVSEKFCN